MATGLAVRMYEKKKPLVLTPIGVWFFFLSWVSSVFFSSCALQDALTFGRPGCGAPVRTKSGRVRTTIIGAPEIRFQENESVKKSIFNSIRYQSNPETKAQYQRELGKSTQLVYSISDI